MGRGSATGGGRIGTELGTGKLNTGGTTGKGVGCALKGGWTGRGFITGGVGICHCCKPLFNGTGGLIGKLGNTTACFFSGWNPPRDSGGKLQQISNTPRGEYDRKQRKATPMARTVKTVSLCSKDPVAVPVYLVDTFAYTLIALISEKKYKTASNITHSGRVGNPARSGTLLFAAGRRAGGSDGTSGGNARPWGCCGANGGAATWPGKPLAGACCGIGCGGCSIIGVAALMSGGNGTAPGGRFAGAGFAGGLFGTKGGGTFVKLAGKGSGALGKGNGAMGFCCAPIVPGAGILDMIGACCGPVMLIGGTLGKLFGGHCCAIAGYAAKDDNATGARVRGSFIPGISTGVGFWPLSRANGPGIIRGTGSTALARATGAVLARDSRFNGATPNSVSGRFAGVLDRIGGPS
jgi:hypothetical protein